jgi:hypothetical protein
VTRRILAVCPWSGQNVVQNIEVQLTHILIKSSLIAISSLHTISISSSHGSGYENAYLLRYNAVKINRRFGRPCRLHPRSNKISSVCYLLYVGFFCWYLEPAGGEDMFLRNVGWTFNGLHGVITQKGELLIPHYLSCDRKTLMIVKTCWSLESMNLIQAVCQLTTQKKWTLIARS